MVEQSRTFMARQKRSGMVVSRVRPDRAVVWRIAGRPYILIKRRSTNGAKVLYHSSGDLVYGWPEGIEPSLPAYQAVVLPLNYDHHKDWGGS
jgi:hypothetical protein